MRLLAKLGAGYHEHFDTKLKSKWTSKVWSCTKLWSFGLIILKDFISLAKLLMTYNKRIISNALVLLWYKMIYCQVKKQIEKSFQPTLTSVSVNWQQFDKSSESNKQVNSNWNMGQKFIFAFTVRIVIICRISLYHDARHILILL